VVVYADTTVALPILTCYALTRRRPRTPRRLYERRAEIMEGLRSAYLEARAGTRASGARDREATAGLAGAAAEGGHAIGRATSVAEDGPG
jgi:deoxyhypusine synthase